MRASSSESSICSSASESGSTPRQDSSRTANVSSATAQQRFLPTNLATASSSQRPGSMESVHAQSHNTPLVPPDSGHASTEKARNLDKQASLKQLDKVELSISQKSKEFKKARDNKDEASTNRIQEDLGHLQKQKKEISKQLSSSRSHSSSRSDSDDEDSANSSSSEDGGRDLRAFNREIERCQQALKNAEAGGNKQTARKLEQKLETLRKERAEYTKATKGGNSSQRSLVIDSLHEHFGYQPINYYLEGIGKTIRKNEQLIEDLQEKLNEPGSESASSDAIDSIEDQIDELRQRNNTFRKVLEILNEGAQDDIDTGIDGKAKSHPSNRDASVADRIRTATKRRRSSMPHPPALSSSRSGATPLQRMHGQTTKSGLLFPEDLKHHLSDKALRKIEDIDAQIENLSEQVDLLRNQASLNADQSKQLLKLTSTLGSLIIEREKQEAIALPKTHTPPAAQHEPLLERVKSKETHRLEDIFKQERSNHEREFESSWSAWAQQMLAGPLAFGASFFVGNSIARAGFPGAGFVGSLVSGALHVVPAGPILKQTLAKSWTAPGLAEFNNYMKLQGASWGDWWRGEKAVKKYQSKNPSETERLTISDRLKQERSFNSILWDRFITEEVPYFSYTINYGIKALGMALGAPYFAAGSAGSIAAEWGAHSVAGFASGAQTVLGIQFMRSLNPQAKEVITPSRKVFEAEADMLDSLLADLKVALEDIENNPPADPDGTTKKELLKAIHKTQKAAAAARTKSEFLGILKYEFMEAFATPDARADTISEMLGRIISVMPIATVSLLLAEWRKSGNPWQAFAAHAIPALVLMTPTLGWTLRPLYAGFIRALAQMCINGSAKHMAAGAGNASVTTNLQQIVIDNPQETDMEEADAADAGQRPGNDDLTRLRIHHDDDDDSKVSEATSEEDRKAKKPSPKDEDGESLVDDDDDEWHGNVKSGDTQGAW